MLRASPRYALVTAAFLSCVVPPLAAQARPSQPRDSIFVLVGAGDIVRCDEDADEATAALIDSLRQHSPYPVTVFTTGDNVYERATSDKFERCYEPSWGRFRDITRPTPGNHDYKNGFLWFVAGGHADPYFEYFNAFPRQAGAPGDGWYRYRLGAWDVYALNTVKGETVKRGSRQWTWLEDAVRGPRDRCAVAYMHHPRFSAGKHGDNDDQDELWTLLSNAGIDIVLAGHDHKYQRFEPQTPDGRSSAMGIRAFVVGTGGGKLRPDERVTAGQLRRITAEHYGVLKLTLYPTRYEWEFITVDDGVWDAGSSTCQNPRGRP